MSLYNFFSDSLRKKASHSTIDNQLNKEPTFTPPPLVQPGSHRGVSRIRDNNDSETVSRSAQYMRNLNNRTIGMGAMNSQNLKKISPLVTQSDLNQRAVIHSPNQGKEYFFKLKIIRISFQQKLSC